MKPASRSRAGRSRPYVPAACSSRKRTSSSTTPRSGSPAVTLRRSPLHRRTCIPIRRARASSFSTRRKSAGSSAAWSARDTRSYRSTCITRAAASSSKSGWPKAKSSMISGRRKESVIGSASSKGCSERKRDGRVYGVG